MEKEITTIKFNDSTEEERKFWEKVYVSMIENNEAYTSPHEVAEKALKFRRQAFGIK